MASDSTLASCPRMAATIFGEDVPVPDVLASTHSPLSTMALQLVGPPEAFQRGVHVRAGAGGLKAISAGVAPETRPRGCGRWKNRWMTSFRSRSGTHNITGPSSTAGQSSGGPPPPPLGRGGAIVQIGGKFVEGDDHPFAADEICARHSTGACSEPLWRENKASSRGFKAHLLGAVSWRLEDRGSEGEFSGITPPPRSGRCCKVQRKGDADRRGGGIEGGTR